MGCVAALARQIAARPELVAAGSLALALLLSALSAVGLARSEVQTGLDAFEIQGQPVGTRAMAAGRFQDWARNSTSQVTCFDSGRDCESSVKADPGMCDYWRYSECCGECVAQGLADGPASAWQYDGAGAGRRRRLGDDGKKGTYTVKLVARTTDGESVLSAQHIQQVQAARDAVLALPSFYAACDKDFYVDEYGSGWTWSEDAQDDRGRPLVRPDTCGPDVCYHSDGCHAAGGVLLRLDKEVGDLDATVDWYADQVWEGHYELITDGLIDAWFSKCNRTSTGTTMSFRLSATKADKAAFMAALSELVGSQPYSSEGVVLAFHESKYEDSMFLATLLSDTYWASGAITFVFHLMLLQTRSFTITLCGFIHILLSLPVGQFVYGVVLGIDWISFLQALPLFIIMGIGADDVFVFLDAWRRSVVDHPEFLKPERRSERLVYVMEHCVKAMTITSVTTSAAFSAICLSPVAPLRCLGIFASTVVMSNFLLCITWFPAIVVSCNKRGWYKDAAGPQAELGTQLVGGLPFGGKPATAGRPVERFFEAYGRSLHDQRTRRAILLGASVITGIAMILAGQLKMPTAMPQLFPPQSNSAMYQAADDELFSYEKYPVPSQVVWGIKAAETSATGQRGIGIAPDDEDKIFPVFDTTVELDSEESQAAIVDTCRRLIAAKSLVRGDVDCPMLSFQQWRQEQRPPLPFPVPQKDFAQAYGSWLRSGSRNTDRDQVLFSSDGRLVGMYGTFSSVLDTNSKNEDVIEVMNKQQKWFQDNDPLHAASVFHSNEMEYRSATLRNISVSGMISLCAQLLMSLFVLLFATGNSYMALLSFASIMMTTTWSMAFMYVAGWSFGILEAICVTVLVGIIVSCHDIAGIWVAFFSRYQRYRC